MSITQTFDLNLIPEQAPVVVHCDQYDEGTGRLIIKLFEGDVAYTPTGTASIQGRKPDGHGFQYSATLAGNTVTADLTFQMSCVSGRVRCQVVVTESTGRTGTFAFVLDVQPSALPSDTDLSDSDYQLIEQALEAAEDAVEAAEDAEAWAVGERGGVPVDPSDPTYNNNAEYWAGQAAIYAQGALKYKGSISFASIPTTGLSGGDMYNITDDFTTDNRFVEGSGVFCPAGTNIAWVDSVSKWDILATIKIGSLDDLNDVAITTPADQQVLTYDSNSGEWINANAQGGVTQLDQLSDVTISAPTDGQSLVYDSNAGEWVNGSGGGGSSTLSGLTDVDITTPTDGQALLYDANSGDWVNGNAGGGDYMGLYGMTEVQSSDGQGTTLLALDQFTSVGNYYCDGKGKISLDILSYINGPRTQYFTTTKSGAEFILYVRTLPNGDHIQTLYLDNYADSSSYIVAERRSYMFNGNREWTHWAMYPSERQSTMGTGVYLGLGGLNNVTLSSVADGDALIYDSSATKWENKPINKVTSLAVSLTGWTADTTSQSGTTLYKKQISLNHVYVESPTVDIGSSGVLPTVAEQESYNLLQYVTVDDAVPCLYLYASDIPTTAFYIKVEGVD